MKERIKGIVQRRVIDPIQEKAEERKLDKLLSPKRSGSLKRYIHIGYPKCASTSLQYDFFWKHRQTLHLGAGVGEYVGYIDEDITLAMEVDLRYARNRMYDEEKVKASFQKYFDEAEHNEKYFSVGCSSEHLAFTYSNDIDNDIKAQRLLDIFGPETEILIILRNQEELLRALYGEHIREGYNGTFQDFMAFTWEFQDRNWFGDFFFHQTVELYQQLFSAKRVHVVPFEVLKHSQEEFFKRLSKAVGVEYYPITFDKHNERMPPSALEYMRGLNDQALHTLRRHMYEPIHVHRYPELYTHRLKQPFPDRFFLDMRMRESLDRVSREASQKLDGPAISYDLDSALHEKIMGAYRQSNQQLQSLLSDDLAALGYAL